MLQELQSKKEFPADVEGSRRLIDEHTQLKKKVRADVRKGLDKLPLADICVKQQFSHHHKQLESSSVGAEGSSGGVGPRRPEAAAVYPI